MRIEFKIMLNDEDLIVDAGTGDVLMGGGVRNKNFPKRAKAETPPSIGLLVFRGGNCLMAHWRIAFELK